MAKSLVRMEQRLKTFAPVRYRGDGIAGEGIIKDLSLNGSYIVGNTPVTVGMVLALHIFVPGNPAQVLLINRATVKWVKRSKFGVDFEPPPPKVAEQITQIVATLMKTPAVSSGKK
jgi:PilZ domain